MRFGALLAVLLLAGCTGYAIDPPGGFFGRGGGSGTGGGSGGGIGGGYGTGGGTMIGGCDPTQFANVQIDTIAQQFETQVYPQMNTTALGGCVACHAPGLGRNLTLYPTDAEQTFYAAWAGHFFDDKPGTILDRLTTPDPVARMPQGGGQWDDAQISPVALVACELKALDQNGGPKPDEIFPPALLHPYTGPPNTDYDNTFINYVQLKAKVKSVFSDDWVRNGTDQFQANIGLFGGVDFQTHFVEARTATPEFLLGLDVLAPDVCAQAANGKTGPFQGFDFTTPTIDQPPAAATRFEAETSPIDPPTGAGNTQGTPANAYFCYTNCTLSAGVDVTYAGSYQVNVRVQPYPDGDGNGPKVEIKLGAQTQDIVVSGTTYQVITATFTNVPVGAMTPFSIAYVNDYSDPPVVNGDRNVAFDYFEVVGPQGTSTGTAHQTAAKAQADLLYQRMLYRHATPAEQGDAYALLTDLEGLGTTQDAYQGLCEALVQHPDFLFTMPPSIDVATGADKQQLMLTRLAQDLLGRPPSQAEFAQLAAGHTYEQFVDDYLASADFQAWFFNRAQLRTESQATPDTDEPARLWTYLAVNDRPMGELLVGDYSVDTSFAQAARPAYHGKSGVLTMKGFLQNKKGLPHYNYAARVFTDLMGYVFEIPPEVFDQRGTATAATTVDPTSICFNCHQNLTPLSYQRRRWDDTGVYTETDAMGAAIDDTDDQLVPTYEFAGHGMEAFATQAVKKEAFIRQTLNSQYDLLLGRRMRYADDERDVYKQLWDVAHTQGTFRAVLKTIALSNKYRR